ncbi:MAG: ACP S-malonyltransferase [Pseudomonadota bacterium]
MVQKFGEDSVGRHLIERASDILSQNIERTFRADDPKIFSSNRNIQVGVFLANHIHLQRLRSFGLRPVASAGLSLGEYNHLVEIGAIEFEDALRLVDARGRLYDDGPPGVMISFFPIAREVLEAAIDRVASLGTVEISNENSPTQYVVAGDAKAVGALADIVGDEEFIEPVTIEERIPMHCRVFEPVAERMRSVLDAAPWCRPKRAYLPNVTGIRVEEPTPEVISNNLIRHVYSPVLWRQSIETILDEHPDCALIEVGPRRVLCNLLSKRWVRNPRFASDELTPEAIVEALHSEPVGTA